MSYKRIPALSIDALTPCFDFMCRLAGYGSVFRERVLKLGDIRNGETILDVGSGTGTFVVLAKRRYLDSRVVGVDPDERALRIAREKVATTDLTVDLVKGGAEALPFES